MIELRVRKGSEEVMKYFLNKETTTIGRAGENDICLPDPSISRTHVTIVRKSDQYFATDRSTNGTFVNDEKISSCEVRPNDIMRVGPWSIVFAKVDEDHDAATEILDRDPTRILSFSPDNNEILFEQAFLKVENQKGRPIPITKSIFSIGKSKSNDLVLSDDYISNFHCKIENRKGMYFLKDLKSTNGVKLNGQKVVETSLPFDSLIEVGRIPVRFYSAEESKPIAPSKKTEFEGMHSKNSRMREIFALLERVAPSDATVLINGETGSGKELIARAVHKLSSRNRKPFIAINCGAISKDLIESELFGHEKGAFTSAHQQRRGVFEQANGGTLFLDEVGELPLDLQPKLLRVLETGEIKRVGGAQLIDVDVRVVAATHRDLGEEVRKNRFREDLFYRLYVVPVHLPPLRARIEDIPLLVDHLMEQEFGSGARGPRKKISKEAVERLQDHNWPGNIRELKNVISRAIIEAPGDTIEVGDLHFAPVGAREQTAHDYDQTITIPKTQTRTLRDVERDRIVSELKRNNWNKKATAQVLGIAKSTLHEKIKKYDIEQGE